jgi:hypothetical protein
MIADQFEAAGIDISAAQIERARRNVPGATFIHAVLMDIEFEAAICCSPSNPTPNRASSGRGWASRCSSANTTPPRR